MRNLVIEVLKKMNGGSTLILLKYLKG